jgi:hypothetical protein
LPSVSVTASMASALKEIAGNHMFVGPHARIDLRQQVDVVVVGQLSQKPRQRQDLTVQGRVHQGQGMEAGLMDGRREISVEHRCCRSKTEELSDAISCPNGIVGIGPVGILAVLEVVHFRLELSKKIDVAADRGGRICIRDRIPKGDLAVDGVVGDLLRHRGLGCGRRQDQVRLWWHRLV